MLPWTSCWASSGGTGCFVGLLRKNAPLDAAPPGPVPKPGSAGGEVAEVVTADGINGCRLGDCSASGCPVPNPITASSSLAKIRHWELTSLAF